MFSTHAQQGRLRHGRWLSWRSTRAGGTRRKLLALLVLAAFFVALLPVLVTKTPLRNMLLSAALPADDVRVTVGAASLSWFSGPELSAVEINNAAGDTLLNAESISMDRSPVNLLLNPRDLGKIEIVRPTLHIKIRPDGSNFEDALAQLLANMGGIEAPQPDETGASRRLTYALQLVEGTIIAEDLAMNRTWRVENISFAYDTRSANQGLGNGSLSAQIVEAGAGPAAAAAPAGRIAISLEEAGDGRQQLSWQTDGLPLVFSEPWLRRCIVAAELSGALSSQGTASWKAAASPSADFASNGFLTIHRLDATAPAFQGDRFRSVHVELPWRLAATPAGLAIEDLQLKSDGLRAAVRGTIDPAAFAAGAALGNAITNPNLRHDVEFRGSLEVAKLAAMLPRALRIRADTLITSGSIDAMGKCQPGASGQLITASLRTARLAATSAGRPLQWDQPVLANLRLTRDPNATRLDSLACDSEFLQVLASGTRQQFAASAKFDLNRLAQQLGQFLDLSGVELAGTGQAQLNWQQDAADAFSARASGTLAALRIALADGAVWAEPQMEIVATAAGRLDPVSRKPALVEKAELQLAAQQDELVARLTGAVNLSDSPPVWPASVEATGRLANWLTRARPWFAPDPWQIEGQGELKANVRIAGRSFEATDTALSVTDLRATAPNWNINEPRVELAGDARWNGDTGALATTAAQFVTSTISLAVKDLVYRPPYGAGPGDVGQLSGAAAFRTDLARLAAWRADAATLAEYRPQGAVTGNVRLTQQNGRIVGELSAKGDNLALRHKLSASRGAGTTAQRGSAPDYETIWQEPQITARGVIAYESAIDQLILQLLQIQSNTLQASANGQIEQLTTAANVNLAGTLYYDLAQLTPLLQPYVGSGIQLVGREQARFALAGQFTSPQDGAFHSVSLSSQSPIQNPQSAVHWSRRIRAQLELPWSGANVYGLPVGAGRIAATLGEGAVRIEPLSLAVGEGLLTTAPQVRLDPPPSELLLPAGPLITNVRISPEVSDAMLKYVAPVLAGATRSEGLFSMQLEGARMPLGEPRQVDSAGKLTVHSVRVVPGSMVREWIGLAQQIEAILKRRDPASLATKPPVTLLSVRDQQVSFRVVDGRVHHQNMEFQVGEVVMRSQGSVGLDETLSLVLHIPIQDAWIAKEPLLAGLKGQTLQVPIAGTLTRPKMDQRAIASLSQQLLQSAAGQAIGGELNKALDKLFKSR